MASREGTFTISPKRDVFLLLFFSFGPPVSVLTLLRKKYLIYSIHLEAMLDDLLLVKFYLPQNKVNSVDEEIHLLRRPRQS